jgi:hypothetical protein
MGSRKAELLTSLSNRSSALTDGLQNDPASRHFPNLVSSLTEQYKFMLEKWTANDFGAASDHATRARDIMDATVGKNNLFYGQTLNIAIETDFVANLKQFALENMKERIRIDDQVVKELFAIGSEEKKLEFAETYWHRMSGFLSVIIQMPSFPNNKNDNQAGLNLVLRRKALALEVSLTQRHAILVGRHPELKDRLDAWMRKKGEIANKTLDGPKPERGPNTERLYQQELDRLNRECERLEDDLAARIPELDRELERQLRSVDCQSIADALPEGSALIEFVQFNFKSFGGSSPQESEAIHYAAFILRKDEPDAVGLRHLGEAEPIDRLIAEFLAAIGQGSGRFGCPSALRSPLEALSIVGNKLSTAVFDPLIEMLGDCKQLFVAPDGELTRLPFAALPRGEGYLISDYNIHYLSVGRDVLRFGPPRARPAEPLVVAAPNFDLAAEEAPKLADVTTSAARQSGHLRDANLHFDELEGMRAEGEAIAEIFRVLLHHGDEASVEWLKQACRSPRILHLATHGFFLDNQQARDREDPLLRAGLALAGANMWLKHQVLPANARDGILNGVDVSELDLLNTELVVLAACETGLGEERKGEGLFGFRRAFVLAGARTLVMSLWRVPDKQTKDLMIDFHEIDLFINNFTITFNML